MVAGMRRHIDLCCSALNKVPLLSFVIITLSTYISAPKISHFSVKIRCVWIFMRYVIRRSSYWIGSVTVYWLVITLCFYYMEILCFFYVHILLHTCTCITKTNVFKNIILLCFSFLKLVFIELIFCMNKNILLIVFFFDIF